jgi:tyrosine-protein kinase Etk/Wzc
MTEQLQSQRDPIEDDDINLIDIFVRLWAGRFTILAFVILGSMIGLIQAYNTPPTYQADSLMQLEEGSRQLGLPQSVAGLSGGSPRSETEIELLKSRLVIGSAVSSLHLDWTASPLLAPRIGHLLSTQDLPFPEWEVLQPYARPGDTISLDLLEMPPAWVGVAIRLTAEAGDSFVITLPTGEKLQGRVGETIIAEGLGLSLRVGTLSGEPGRVFVLRQIPEASAVSMVRNGLNVSEQGRQSGILRLTYTSSSPELARRTLDEIALAYLSQNAARSAAEVEGSLAFVQSQLPLARAAAQEAEMALTSFRETQQAIDLSVEGGALLTQIRSLEAELVDVANLEEEISERYTRNHPEYQRLLSNRERVEERLLELRDEVSVLPAAQREVLNLTQDLSLARDVFVQLRNSAQELQVLSASNIGNVRIIDRARAGLGPIAPRKTRILALMSIIGLLLGVGTVLARSYLRNSIVGSEDLEALGLAVFATLNRHPSSLQSMKSRKSLPLVAVDTPNDLFVEGLRSLRTGLHFAMLDAKTNSILFTSPAPGVGKSFISANLAVVVAQSGKKVCLIDSDMRRGLQHKYFGLPKAHPGLAQLLSGSANLASVLTETHVENLSIISKGPNPPNPSELLMREGFANLIKTLNQQFDLIIVDAPPVLAVTDPVVLARAVGSVIAVARFEETHPAEIQAMIKVLDTASVKIGGAILNDFNPKKARGRYSYAYTYNARYSYESSE